MDNYKKNKFISGRTVLGQSGESLILSYGTVTLIDNGCFDIYGNLTLNIDKLINNKELDSINSYEIKAIGDAGKDGNDSVNGEDAESGQEGISTNVTIKINQIEGDINVISIGGKGGDGGNGINGLDGGNGGDAAIVNSVVKGGNGGDASDGYGNGGDGGKGGKGPTVTIEYGSISQNSSLNEYLMSAKGGKGGSGGKGGKGGGGGKNGDGITFAMKGRDGNDCEDGAPGECGELGKVIFKCIGERSTNYEFEKF